MALPDFRYTRRAAAVQGIADIEQQMVELESWLRQLKAELAAAGGDVAADALWDAKGDLAVGTGPDAAARLPVGTDKQLLVADSAAATGVKWEGGAYPLTTGFGINIYLTAWDSVTSPPGTNWTSSAGGAGCDVQFTDEYLDLWAHFSFRTTAGDILWNGAGGGFGVLATNEYPALDLASLPTVAGQSPQKGLNGSQAYFVPAGIMSVGTTAGARNEKTYPVFLTYLWSWQIATIWFIDSTGLLRQLTRDASAWAPGGLRHINLDLAVRLPKAPSSNGYTGIQTTVSGQRQGSYFGKVGAP